MITKKKFSTIIGHKHLTANGAQPCMHRIFEQCTYMLKKTHKEECKQLKVTSSTSTLYQKHRDILSSWL